MNYIYLSGAILGILSTLKLKTAKQKGLSFVGIIETIHSIEGRSRFIVPSLKGDKNRADILKNEMSKLKDSELVKVNTLTGSVVVNYNSSKLDHNLILTAIIHILDLDKQINSTPSKLMKNLKCAKESLNSGIYESSKGIIDLDSAVFLLLLFGFAKSLITGRFKSAEKATLAWWIFQLIK